MRRGMCPPEQQSESITSTQRVGRSAPVFPLTLPPCTPMMTSSTPSPLMSPAEETMQLVLAPLITNPFVPSSEDSSITAGKGDPACNDCAEPASKATAADTRASLGISSIASHSSISTDQSQRPEHPKPIGSAPRSSGSNPERFRKPPNFSARSHRSARLR